MRALRHHSSKSRRSCRFAREHVRFRRSALFVVAASGSRESDSCALCVTRGFTREKRREKERERDGENRNRGKNDEEHEEDRSVAVSSRRESTSPSSKLARTMRLFIRLRFLAERFFRVCACVDDDQRIEVCARAKEKKTTKQNSNVAVNLRDLLSIYTYL